MGFIYMGIVVEMYGSYNFIDVVIRICLFIVGSFVVLGRGFWIFFYVVWLWVVFGVVCVCR